MLGFSWRPSWTVLAVGLIATALGVAVLPRPQGVYWGRAEVSLVAPESSHLDPQGEYAESLALFAVAMERELNANLDLEPLASNDATLYGRGVTSGYSVTLTNDGSQWRPIYRRPTLIVEAVDPDPEQAEKMLLDTIALVQETVLDRQLDADVPKSMLIWTVVNPPDPAVTYVAGNYRRLQLGSLMAGVLLTLGVASGVERRRRDLNPDPDHSWRSQVV